MSLTRPPVMTEEEAEHTRAVGGRVYQTPKDPRVSWILNWVFGVIACMLTAGGIGTFSMLFAMREQLAIIASRPEPASRDQVAYLQRQIDDLKAQVAVRNERP